MVSGALGRKQFLREAVPLWEVGEAMPKKDDPVIRQIKAGNMAFEGEEEIQGKVRVQSIFRLKKLVPLAKDLWHEKEILDKHALLF
jgi:hypothetical protein